MASEFPPVNPGPAHLRIAAAVVDLIAEGGLVAGDRLPPERALAVRFGVSRMTVRQALDSLERSGTIERRVGRTGGTFVAEASLELTGLVALSDQLRGLGIAAGARVLDATERPARGEEVATLGAGSVYALRRLRYANGRLIALERTVLPASAYPGLLDQPLHGSLYGIMRTSYAEIPVRATERLSPTVARADETAELEVEVGAPLLLVVRVGYGPSGRALEFSHDLFRGDRLRVVWETEIPEVD